MYDFHLDRLIDVYTEFTLDSMGDRPSLLRAHPKWEQCIYEQVCYQLGITPVAEHVGSGAVTARSSISETNLARSNLSVHWATPVAEYVGPGAVRARSSITGTKRTGSNLSFPRDDSKNYETQEASKKRLWSDESEMDFLSKKLAKDRSFTESCSAVSANSKCPTLKKVPRELTLPLIVRHMYNNKGVSVTKVLCFHLYTKPKHKILIFIPQHVTSMSLVMVLVQQRAEWATIISLFTRIS